MIVKLKRGTTALVGQYTGAAGSLVVDTQTKQIYLQDGVTPGGSLIVGLSEAFISNLIDTKLAEVDVAAVAGLQAALDAKVASADLFDAGKIKAALLPSYVDDVLEFSDEASFPVEGEAGKIYIETTTSKSFRWTGTVYVQIVASPGTTSEIAEGSNLFFTDERARDAISLAAGSDAGLTYNPVTGEFGYTAPAGAVKATGAELIAGVDDAKFATAAGISALLANIGLTTDGSTWTLDEGVLA